MRPAVTRGKVSYHCSNNIFLILTEGTDTSKGLELELHDRAVNAPAARSDWPDGFCHCLGAMTFPSAGSLAQHWLAGVGHTKCCGLEIGLSSSWSAAKARAGTQHKASASDWYQHATATGTTKPQREGEEDLRAAPQDTSERSCWGSLASQGEVSVSPKLSALIRALQASSGIARHRGINCVSLLWAAPQSKAGEIRERNRVGSFSSLPPALLCGWGKSPWAAALLSS